MFSTAVRSQAVSRSHFDFWLLGGLWALIPCFHWCIPKYFLLYNKNHSLVIHVAVSNCHPQLSMSPSQTQTYKDTTTGSRASHSQNDLADSPATTNLLVLAVNARTSISILRGIRIEGQARLWRWLSRKEIHATDRSGGPHLD